MSTISLGDCHPLVQITALHATSPKKAGWTGGRASHSLNASSSGEGLYYYEAKILIKPNTGGVVRVGWSWDKLPSPVHEVGKDSFSLGYDGQKGCRMYKNKRIPYGEPYGDGDIIGSFLNMTFSHNITISFSRNGKVFEHLTLYFPCSIHSNDDLFIDCPMLPFYPSFALKNAAVLMNFGSSPFVYAPVLSSGYRAVSSARLHSCNLLGQLLQIRIPSSAVCEERSLLSFADSEHNNIAEEFEPITKMECSKWNQKQMQTAIHQQLFERGKTGNTLLHQAISNHNWNACTALIQKLMCLPLMVRREFVSIRNRQGKTALHIATNIPGNIKFAILLVKAGFSLFVKDKDLMTPLQYTAHDVTKRDILFRCGGSRQAFAIFLAGYGFLTLRFTTNQQKNHPGKIEPR